MSLILDALNRADNERKNQNAVPDISTLHTPSDFTHTSNKSSKTILIIGLAIIVAILIAIFAWWFKRDNQPPQIVVPVAEPVKSNSTSQLQSSQPLPQKTEVVSPVEQAPVVKQETVAATQITSSTVNEDINQLYEAPQAESVVDSDVNALYAAESSVGSTAVIDPFAGEENTSDVAPTEPEISVRTFASITNIPDFNALPWNMRQSIPTITYARHNFLANGVSSVVINNQTVGVGNIISVGQFVVQEIYVDGVVLKHGNTQFKLRALNGWINM